MYYAGEVYENRIVEKASLRLEDMKLNWSQKQKFDGLMLSIIMSDELEINIIDHPKLKKYEIAIFPLYTQSQYEYANFDIYYNINRVFHSAEFQDILVGGVLLNKSSRLKCEQLFRVLNNYISTGKVSL